MAKITFRTGNFSLDIEGELNANQKAKALENGITYIVQRDVASAAYRELAGEGEKKTLPKGFERSSLEYTPESAAKVEEVFTEKMAKYGTFAVNVSEHVSSEGAAEPGVMAKNMWEQVKANPALRANLGVAADASDEAGVEACSKFLATLRPPRKAKAEKAA